MSEARDPAIKLFGRMIPLPERQAAGEPAETTDPCAADKEAEEGKTSCRETLSTKAKSTASERSQEMDQIEPDASFTLNGTNEDDCESPKQDERASDDPKTEQEQNEADGNSQQKTPKKPDKVLPCPRCNSLDTKFCYYNNYNVNQPRHFCKNCQRYWTAGGTMRNVPVGAGRRKNKHSASHYRHMLMPPDAIPSPQVEHPDTICTQVIASGLPGPMKPLKGNGTVLKFGTESPLCESMASVLSLGDQKRNAEIGPAVYGENGEEPSCASSITALNGVENKFPDNSGHMEQNDMQSCCDEPNPIQHLHCYPGPPWTYPWAPGWNGFAPVAGGHFPSELMYGQQNGNTNEVSWNTPVMMAAPAFCPPAIPFPYIPASFWGCMSGWPNGTWNMPWIGATAGLSPSFSASNGGGGSGNASPTLGKHSRDVGLQVEEKIEKSLWIPKTLRIDDPDEAAKSSIWATLGIKPDVNEPVKRAGIFKAFQPKTEGKNHPSGAQVLHANPAALSRSQTFQEST